MEEDKINFHKPPSSISIGDTLKIYRQCMGVKNNIRTTHIIIGIQAANLSVHTTRDADKTYRSIIFRIISPKKSRDVTNLWVVRSTDNISRCRMVLTERRLVFQYL